MMRQHTKNPSILSGFTIEILLADLFLLSPLPPLAERKTVAGQIQLQSPTGVPDWSHDCQLGRLDARNGARAKIASSAKPLFLKTWDRRAHEARSKLASAAANKSPLRIVRKDFRDFSSPQFFLHPTPKRWGKEIRVLL